MRTERSCGHWGRALAPHIPQCCHQSPAELWPLQKSPTRFFPASQGFLENREGPACRDPQQLGKPHPRGLGAASEFPQETVGMQQKMQSCLLPAQQMQFLLIHPSPGREFKVSAHSSGSSALKFTTPAPHHPQELPQHQALGQEYLGSGRCKEKRAERGLRGGESPTAMGLIACARREQLGFAPGVEPWGLCWCPPHTDRGSMLLPIPFQERPVLWSRACLPKTEGWQAKMQQTLRD